MTMESQTDESVPNFPWLRAHEVEAVLLVLKNGGVKTLKHEDKPLCTVVVPPAPASWSMVMFMAHTGARPGEMMALRWEDVDLVNRMVRLVSVRGNKAMKRTEPRLVPIKPDLFSFFISLPPGSPDQPVFRRNPTLNHDFIEALRCAGLPPYPISVLRDTFAANLSIQGFPLEHLARIMGNTLVATGMRYSQLAPVDFAGAMQKLNYAVSQSNGEGQEDDTGV